MNENPNDELLLTLRIKRFQLRYLDDGTLYMLWDRIGSAIHIGDDNDTPVVELRRSNTEQGHDQIDGRESEEHA